MGLRPLYGSAQQGISSSLKQVPMLDRETSRPISQFAVGPCPTGNRASAVNRQHAERQINRRGVQAIDGCSRLSGSCSVIDAVGASCIAPGIAGARRDAFGISDYSLAAKLLGVSTYGRRDPSDLKRHHSTDNITGISTLRERSLYLSPKSQSERTRRFIDYTRRNGLREPPFAAEVQGQHYGIPCLSLTFHLSQNKTSAAKRSNILFLAECPTDLVG